MSNQDPAMRWDPYSLTTNVDFDGFWATRLAQRPRKLLLIMGRGFDIRTLEIARRLVGLGADIMVWQLAFDNGLGDSETRAGLTEKNDEGLQALVTADHIVSVPIEIGGPAGAAVTSRNTKVALEAAGTFDLFDDVIVDISAMPRMVAMTAVSVLLFSLDKIAQDGDKSVNLHVKTAESVSADLGAAKGSLRDSVTFVLGFSGHLEAQTTQNWPLVWFPVLGEGQRDRLNLIRNISTRTKSAPSFPFRPGSRGEGTRSSAAS